MSRDYLIWKVKVTFRRWTAFLRPDCNNLRMAQSGMEHFMMIDQMVSDEIEYYCRVCGFGYDDQEQVLWSPEGPSREVICECCSNHVGVDDYAYEQVLFERTKWVNAGYPWWAATFDDESSPPPNWNPKIQMKQIPKRWR